MIEHLIKAATCRVTCDSMSGTGWLITPACVITARHCILAAIEDGKPIELLFPALGDSSVAGKIVDHSEDLDICLLSLETASTAEPLPVSLELPREGETWQTFGYPQSKSAIGHRLEGSVAQTLNVPTQKIDIDLSIDPSRALHVYKGISGGAVVCNGFVVGMIRLRLDGTIAAVSLKRSENFLVKNGVAFPDGSTTPSVESLASRGGFSEFFSEAVQNRRGNYLFLEGAHGYGKSTFCRHFQADEQALICLGAYCLSDPESSLGPNYRAQPQVFLDWLSMKISGLITGQPPRKEEKTYPEQIRATADYIEAFSEYSAKRGRQGILFIDGLNEIPGATMLEDLVGLLPAKLPPHVSVVLTAPNFATVATPLSGRIQPNDIFELPPLPNFACYHYCQHELKPERSSPALIDSICERAKGHPLYLRYLIEYANTETTNQDLDEFPVLTGSIEEYYQRIWANLLPDGDALNLLALMARLRWGLSLVDFAKALNQAEQSQFISVTSRIRHLLADDKSTSIYHASFATFIVERTAGIDSASYKRLAKFCCEEPAIRYCALNRIFHLLQANDNAVFAECNQTWFDTAVRFGVEPDALITDVDDVAKRAALEASPDEFFRITLLAQRIGFRYDTLFAQSARLIAEVLIVLGRPSEALQHVMRLKTLIVGPGDALEIAYLLHTHGYDHEALVLLDRAQQRILESCQPPIALDDFLNLCTWRLRTLFQIRLAIDGGGVEQFLRILTTAKGICEELLGEDAEAIKTCMDDLSSELPAHFLSFHDEYADLSRIRSKLQAHADLSKLLPPLYLALLKFESTVENFRLSKSRRSLTALFADLGELVPNSEIPPPLTSAICDTLIRFGAPAAVVAAFDAKGSKGIAQKLHLREKNGVDVNHQGLKKCLYDWRVSAFLESSFRGSSSGIIVGSGWSESLEHLIGALYCCDGRARRAKADSDEIGRTIVRDQLKAQVVNPLRFTLQERATWRDSYAIPENALPEVYQQLAELLYDCFPEDLNEWLDNLVADARGQWGMYSEGFRASAFRVLDRLTREKPNEELASQLFGLLQALRDHVLRGVENRHELVPEILKLIPIFARLGAKEEAEKLYQRLLSVSMGPTWYKEDQLGIMTTVLKNICINQEVVRRLPQVAGYLEKASGDMTFQRYVRAEKSSLLGQIARQGKHRAAFAYFRRQCCGSTSELWAEAQQGPIDMIGPFKGNRYPGGALDDQAAILAIVRNSGAISWVLRWALLEIFHCGDSRHLDDYAEAFGKIANEVGAPPELTRRAKIVADAETPSDSRKSFILAFRNVLRPELHTAFPDLLGELAPSEPAKPSNPPVDREPDDVDTEDGFFSPGVFGRRGALRNSEKILKDAERQWALGNHKSAKAEAVKALKVAQEGGWSIWGNLSGSTQRAEEILTKEEINVAEVLRYYAPLIEDERYAPKWFTIQHLIGRVGTLFSETEGRQLLDVVIDHCRLIVGSAESEIQAFEFLSDDEPEAPPDVECFRFIVWLCDHPQWLRRDRAAALLLWIFEQIPELFPDVVATAFSMNEGYGPDVLCGVLDGASVREPAAVWETVAKVMSLAKITQDLKHVSRMAVLERLAARGDKAGSSTAKSARVKIMDSFTGKSETKGDPSLPIWAGSLATEWRKIAHLLGPEIQNSWQEELERLSSPLSVTDALSLERAVTASFREGMNRPLNRWESKLRYALNVALWQYIPCEKAREIEAALRPFNPSQPERTMLSIRPATTDQLLAAIESGDYSAALASNPEVLLNYQDMAEDPTADEVKPVEVLCLLQPASALRPAFGTQIDQSFRSSELPTTATIQTPFETCCRLDPELVFFGPFTPPIPLPFFQDLVGAKDYDFVRKSWRFGRRNNLRRFGQPERAGCSLSIPRDALKIPPELKLVWIVWLKGEVAAIVDEYNNFLFKP